MTRCICISNTDSTVVEHVVLAHISSVEHWEDDTFAKMRIHHGHGRTATLSALKADTGEHAESIRKMIAAITEFLQSP